MSTLSLLGMLSECLKLVFLGGMGSSLATRSAWNAIRVPHALWLRHFISRLGVVDSIARPLKIYCDNTAAVFFSKNGKYSGGSKHMEAKYLLVRERVQKKRVLIVNLSTPLMITDPFTKGLPPKTYKEHVIRMGLLSNP